ncbi:outer membrane beta-barrel protein [Dyadobacter sp. CY345]|uniref:porin family protein n=1 Tax=Dyadobacter sp. CY345 TaxID=2909335 RepID=UPI001F2AECB6|nr:outer membrane beta-barrel protein [Dyadobacter sp. CY345]MCF2447667.1 outer membrane beta-barrel protein [Dyadobacter sp. CY345]
MKLHSIIIASAFILFSTYGFGQDADNQSVKELNEQKQNIEASKKLNEQKIQLAELENELAKKKEDAVKASTDAQQAANENKEFADKLRQNPKDKKLANQASKAARKAERSARSANKTNENQEQLTKDIASLREKISQSEAEVTAAPALSGTATAGNLSQGAVNNNLATTTQATQQNASGQVVQRNFNVDSLMSSGSTQNITEKVLESTYRNYPPQQGQPSIIINNIIIPSDYQRPQNQGMVRQSAQPERQDRIRDEDYEDYRAWLRERNRKPARQQLAAEESRASSDRLTFKERFGEKPARNSGLWVIPVVGVHASNFKADIQDGEADGRIGWNAGLDFRIHTKRFFVQPGVHYFSSSMRFTSESEVSNAPLLSGPRIQSLRVPLLLGLYLTKANKGFFKMNIKGGATGSYLLAVDNNDQNAFNEDNIEEFSYGLNGGIGLEFGLITLDISHEWGITRLFKDSDMKNNILRATIGLKL